MHTLAFLLTLTFCAQDDDPKSKIDRWVGELGSEDFETREKATAELKKIGKPATEALRKAAESSDPEVKMRAKSILEAIEKSEKKPKPERSGASISVQIVNGDSTYTVKPAEGDPISFKRVKDGSVELEYTDDHGKKVDVRSDSLAEFLDEHADLAKKYGITKDGISYGGARSSFGGGRRNLPRMDDLDPFELQKKLAEEQERLREELKKFGLPGLDPESWGGDLNKTLAELFKRFQGFNFGDEDPTDPLQLPNPRLGERIGAAAHGAAFGSVDDVLRAHLEIPEGTGIVVRRVKENSLAARFEFMKHDIVLAIDGKSVANTGDFSKSLKEGSTVSVLRAGKKCELKIKE